MMSPFAAFIFLLGLSVASSSNFTVVYDWDENELDYLWPTEANRTAALQDESYFPNKLEPYFLAVYKERLFISLYMFSGVPVTLVSLPTSSASDSPKLAPFPSWQLHEKDNCDSISQARGLEVDPEGRLWVVDNGNAKCRSKIWIFDLANNDKTELVYTFPQEVVHPMYIKRRLNDIVLDKTPDDTIAYISDLEISHIVAFSLKRRQSWSVKTQGKTFAPLALTPQLEGRRLYLGRSYSRELYSVPVSELRAASENAATLTLVGEWSQLPLRMTFDDANVLYAAFYDTDYVSTLNISGPLEERKLVEVEPLGATLPFTFVLDEAGTFWLTERNEQGEDPSHRLLKTSLSTKYYLHSASAGKTL